MSPLLYSATMSLDGYIAGPGGDMSWLTPYLGPNHEVDGVIDEIGALLVGAKTFRGDDPHRGTAKEGKPFGGGWEGPQFVVTHHVPPDPAPGITFVDDLVEGVRLATEAAAGKFVNILGADIAAQCLAAGLVDELLILIAPLLLGDGTRLFAGQSIALERIHQSAAPLATNLRFRVVRNGS